MCWKSELLDKIYYYHYYPYIKPQISNRKLGGSMLYQILNKIDQQYHIETAKAHCDIPCGIYDPIVAQISALTVVRMLDLMTEFDGKTPDRNKDYMNSMARYIAVKEEHAERAKAEVRVIWGDYLKAQHLEKYPNVHALVHKIMQLGSKVRQTTDREQATQLVDAINEFAQIFWETKGIATKRAKAPYAPALELVYPVL
jgi:nickel superoxide dismutase